MVKKIRGLEIKEHIPNEILSMVEQSVKEAGYEWTDEFIKECCLTAPPSNYYYCNYKCHPVFHSHKGFLFGFSETTINGKYLFSWSKPYKHRND